MSLLHKLLPGRIRMSLITVYMQITSSTMYLCSPRFLRFLSFDLFSVYIYERINLTQYCL